MYSQKAMFYLTKTGIPNNVCPPMPEIAYMAPLTFENYLDAP